MTMATRFGRCGLRLFDALWLTSSAPLVPSSGSPQVTGDDWHGIGKGVVAELLEHVAFDVPADGGDRYVADVVGERRVEDRADALEDDEDAGDHGRERHRPPGIGGREGAEETEGQQRREGGDGDAGEVVVLARGRGVLDPLAGGGGRVERAEWGLERDRVELPDHAVADAVFDSHGD